MDAKPADHRKSKRDFRYAESQLRNLNTKIDKLLNKLDEKEQDEAKTPEEECVICVNSKATMETWPCGHRVVCRKCLVRTIQIAVSRRSLPLRCVVCRARVLRLKRSSEARVAASASAAAAAATASSADGHVVDTGGGGGGRSRSLPTKLRRHASVAAAVAVRSRSVGTAKTNHRRQTAAVERGPPPISFAGAVGWAEAFATDHDDDRHTSAVKYSKLDATDRIHGNQSKNGLKRILSKCKFWRYLRFKHNKP